MLQDVSEYRRLTQLEHVRLRPDTYVGAVAIQERDEYIAMTNPETSQTQITPAHILVSDAIERVFLEILSNATDNIGRSRRAGMQESDIKGVDVMMTEDTITIVNYGLPINMDIHPETGIPLIELLFGNLLTGDNYGNNTQGAGRNGLGASLCNIFSVDFNVHVKSSFQNSEYSQTWHNGMTIKEDPIIQPYIGPSSVSVTWRLDFAAMGYTNNKYTNTDLMLFKRHVMDASLTNKVITSFNGERFDFKDIRKYMKSCSFLPKGAGQIVHIEYNNPQQAPPTDKEYWKHTSNLPMTEMCVIETPDNAHNIAFTNGIINRLGGVHLENAIESVSTIMTGKVNELFEKSGHGKVVNKGDVRKHISIIIACRLVNPAFDCQSKTALKSPKIKIKLKDEEVKALGNFGLLYKRLLQDADSKAYKKLLKGNGKKSRHVHVEAAEDANWAGTKRSGECVLMLTEGKSATGYAVQSIKHIPGGRDICGIYPMKGKPLNTMNANMMKIVKNEVIMEMRQLLGLREEVDYTNDTAYNTLRYGRILIMADSDEDGKHIIALVINIFNTMYPSLVRRGFIMILRTPIVRVYKGSYGHCFFSHKQYLEWANNTPDHAKWEHKYLKGLGSSSKEEVKTDFQAPRYVHILYDDNADAYLQLAFNDKLSDDRKRWIATIQQPLGVEEWDMLPISHFINEELVTFARDNLGRSIPRLMDGLKDSQRKIIWGIYCKWGGCGRYEDGTRKISRSDLKTAPTAKSHKVDSFASFVYENTAYKHGQPCLAKTISAMAADYPGSNNIPYFHQDGMFGTRNLNGQDSAQPRYAQLKPASILPSIFPIADFHIMNFRHDEGRDQEPIVFYSVIPMVLVNGANGIGSGHSTFIPSFNPFDVINWYKMRLQGIVYQHDLVPWFRGFTGTVELVEVRSDKANSLILQPHINGAVPLDISHEEGGGQDDLGDEETVNQEDRTDGEIKVEHTFGDVKGFHKAIRITGCMHREGDNVVITDIPIGRSIHGYKNFLDGLVQEKKLVDYKNYSTDHLVHFILEGYTGPINNHDLRLISKMGMTNMVLLDENDTPIKYPTIASILETFYQQRLPIYQKRKDYLLEEELRIIKELDEKLRFVTEVVNETITIFKRNKQEIVTEMVQKGYSKELFAKVSLTSLTKDDIVDLQNKIQQHTDTYNQLYHTTIESMWIADLDNLETTYKKIYK